MEISKYGYFCSAVETRQDRGCREDMPLAVASLNEVINRKYLVQLLILEAVTLFNEVTLTLVAWRLIWELTLPRLL
jgi:hypothetical protein